MLVLKGQIRIPSILKSDPDSDKIGLTFMKAADTRYTVLFVFEETLLLNYRYFNKGKRMLPEFLKELYFI